MSKDKLDLSNHSITVENLPDAIDGAYVIGYPIALSARGVTESEGFIAYNERDFIMMAYDMLTKSLDDCIILKEYREPSEKEIRDIMREQYSWCDDPITDEEFEELDSVGQEDHTPDVTTIEDTFNVNCARYMGFETMYNNLGYGSILVYAPTRDGWDSPEPYNPYNNLNLLAEVVDSLVESGKHHRLYQDEVSAMGTLPAYREYVADILVTDEDRREQHWAIPEETFVDVTQCDFREEPKIFREQVKPMEEIGDPRDVRWQAARILVLANYRGYKSFYVDQAGAYRLSPSVGLSLNVDATEVIELLNGTSNGLCQVVSLESYIRNPANGITLWEKARIENPYRGDDPDAITLEVIHKHRVLLLWRCLEMMTEPYQSDETKFKGLCIKIKTTFECEGYCLDTSTFSPYYNMPQLVGIVEMVVQHSGQPFTIHPALGGQIDMESVMRAFVTKYSTEQYLPEIYVVK